MGLHQRIPFTSNSAPLDGVASEYQLLEECILSGQVPDAEVQSLIAANSGFADWLRARVHSRAHSL